MNGKISAFSIAVALLFGAPAANAVAVLNSWNLNLSLLGVGASDATNIDYIDVTGKATVYQNVVGGVALGQSFTEDGYLQMPTYHKEGSALTTNMGLGSYSELFLLYTGLTGTLNGDGSVTFDPYGGTVQLVLGQDGNTTVDPGDLVLANFDVIAPSGGSDLNFYGGAGANATVDVTLDLLNTYNNLDLFTDQFNNPIDPGFFLHLVNVNSLLDPNFSPNPDNSGIDANGNGVSIIHVQNAGQYNIARVPEPGVLALLATGLLGLVGTVGKRRRS